MCVITRVAISFRPSWHHAKVNVKNKSTEDYITVSTLQKNEYTFHSYK